MASHHDLIGQSNFYYAFLILHYSFKNLIRNAKRIFQSFIWSSMRVNTYAHACHLVIKQKKTQWLGKSKNFSSFYIEREKWEGTKNDPCSLNQQVHFSRLYRFRSSLFFVLSSSTFYFLSLCSSVVLCPQYKRKSYSAFNIIKKRKPYIHCNEYTPLYVFIKTLGFNLWINFVPFQINSSSRETGGKMARVI